MLVSVTGGIEGIKKGFSVVVAGMCALACQGLPPRSGFELDQARQDGHAIALETTERAFIKR
jgi:hypothetical protein